MHKGIKRWQREQLINISVGRVSVLWKIPIAEIFSWPGLRLTASKYLARNVSGRHKGGTGGTSGLINLHKIKTLQLNFQQNKTR